MRPLIFSRNLLIFPVILLTYVNFQTIMHPLSGFHANFHIKIRNVCRQMHHSRNAFTRYLLRESRRQGNPRNKAWCDRRTLRFLPEHPIQSGSAVARSSAVRKTYQEIIRKMESKYGKVDRIWCSDRGVTSEQGKHRIVYVMIRQMKLYWNGGNVLMPLFSMFCRQKGRHSKRYNQLHFSCWTEGEDCIKRK